MAPIWNVRVHHRLASGVEPGWINSFQITGGLTGQPKSAFASVVEHIITGFKTGLLSTAYITQVTFNEMLTMPGVEETKTASLFGDPLIFPRAGDFGTRVLSDEREGLDRTLIAWKGRERDEPGRIELRHHLVDDDVVYSAHVSPSLSTPQGFTIALAKQEALEAMRGELDGAGYPMVMASWPILRYEQEPYIGPRGAARSRKLTWRDPRIFAVDMVTELAVNSVGTRDVGGTG